MTDKATFIRSKPRVQIYFCTLFFTFVNYIASKFMHSSVPGSSAKPATVLSQHWHGFALSAQIHICYTEDAQKHIKLNLVASRRLYRASAFCIRKRKGGASLNTSNNLPQLPPPRKSSGRWLYAAWLGVSILPLLTQPASATTIWEKATEIMKDVYQQILLISTIAAIVTASVALLMMNFSRSGRTVEESRAWLKRIAITWAILNGLGFIMAYVTPFFSGGQWTA